MDRTMAVAAAAVVVAGLATGGYFAFFAKDPGQCSVSTVAGGDIGGPFELVAPDGRTVTDTDVITKPSLVYFGYTYCPDVCPFDMSRNAEAVDLLAARGYDVTPVFITIDPERDTPEVLGDYAFNLHENMIALGGSEAQIAAASNAYKTYYKAHKDGTQDYLVDHSTFTYLMFPHTGFQEFFRRDVTAAAMAETVACFVDNV